MTLVKSQVSSHRKGKEVISAPPATRDVGEEVVYSELNHSNEEQVQRDPDSEYAPLIYPWYDIHPHFQKILSDYTPPLPSCVWLALCRQNTDISWAPLASSIPNLVIRQGTLLPVPIHFEFGSGTALDWKEWVDNKLSDTGFMGLLQRAGVLKAIISSRYLSNFWDLFNLRHLVRQWCTTTHAFFFSCGEVTVTLENVANQLLLPILGDIDLATLELSLKEEAMEAELKKRMSGNAKLSYWISSSSKFSVFACCAVFVVFWLCKFVFGSHPHYTVKP